VSGKSTLLKMLLLALFIGAILAAWKASRVLPMGAGYIAKTVCSEYFVAGRKDAEHIWSDIRDINPLFKWGGYEIDESSRQVSGFFSPGLMKTTAVYREGLGCTIAKGLRPDELRPLQGQSRNRNTRRQALPVAASVNPQLESVLDTAFSEPAETSHRQTRAVVVLKNGRIVGERYAASFDRATPLIGWSMTKSVINTLVGMRVGDGVFGLDDPAPVPEWQSADDPRKQITIRNLLQMSSGLEFEEVYEPGSDATNMLFTAYSAAAYAAAAPLGHEPGTHWAYSSGTTNILARIFRDSVGDSLAATHDFARDRLFEPLGITSMVLEPDASGSPVGSSFSYATARDWARLGQFWLQDGQWNGQRLLPQGWMQWSTSPAPAAEMGQYGAQFWLNAGVDGEHRSFPDLPASMYFAHGFNSQIVAVFPEQELVVVRLGFTTDESWDDNAFLSSVLTALGRPLL
jgi:CubicO group peptidase (beta-lactamase class C family)